jgi:hypothetical protein
MGDDYDGRYVNFQRIYYAGAAWKCTCTYILEAQFCRAAKKSSQMTGRIV